jgi:hypothetical protein
MLMRKLYLILLIAFLLTQVACTSPQSAGKAATPKVSVPSTPPQDNAEHSAVDQTNPRTQAETMVAAFIKHDFRTAADFTYSGVVSKSGGKEKMAGALEKGMTEVEQQGFRLESVTVEDPTQVLSGGRQLFAVLPNTMRMRVPDDKGVLVSHGFYIGVSDDGGKTWTFIDGTGVPDRKRLKVVLPSAPESLKLPERQPPVLQQ